MSWSEIFKALAKEAAKQSGKETAKAVAKEVGKQAVKQVGKAVVGNAMDIADENIAGKTTNTGDLWSLVGNVMKYKEKTQGKGEKKAPKDDAFKTKGSGTQKNFNEAVGKGKGLDLGDPYSAAIGQGTSPAMDMLNQARGGGASVQAELARKANQAKAAMTMQNKPNIPISPETATQGIGAQPSRLAPGETLNQNAFQMAGRSVLGMNDPKRYNAQTGEYYTPEMGVGGAVGTMFGDFMRSKLLGLDTSHSRRSMTAQEKMAMQQQAKQQQQVSSMQQIQALLDPNRSRNSQPGNPQQAMEQFAISQRDPITGSLSQQSSLTGMGVPGGQMQDPMNGAGQPQDQLGYAGEAPIKSWNDFSNLAEQPEESWIGSFDKVFAGDMIDQPMEVEYNFNGNKVKTKITGNEIKRQYELNHNKAVQDLNVKEKKDFMSLISGKGDDAGKFLQGIEQSKFTNRYNSLSTGRSLYSLSDTLVDGYLEGGAGSPLAATGSKLATTFPLSPRALAKKYAKTSAIPGKQFEVIGKMFPMLTQQIGKEGSIRIIQKMLEKMEANIPGADATPEGALAQMESTINSLVDIRLTMERMPTAKLKEFLNLGKQYDKQLRESKESEWDQIDKNYEESLDSLYRDASSIQLTPEEETIRADFAGQATKPIRDFLEAESLGRLDDFQKMREDTNKKTNIAVKELDANRRRPKRTMSKQLQEVQTKRKSIEDRIRELEGSL